MLFPYEEFVKFFQCEVFDLSPRGLVNCGNRYGLSLFVSIGLFAKLRIVFYNRKIHLVEMSLSVFMLS